MATLIHSNLTLIIMLGTLIFLVSYYGMKILEEIRYFQMERAFVKTIIDTQREKGE